MNKIEDLNLSTFNMITEINELKTLTKHISCKCKYKLDGRLSQIHAGIMRNIDARIKNIIYVKKIMF